MNRAGMNMETVKIRNRSLILKFINDHGPVSRKELAAATGLTPASVTQITMQLISEDLLTELGAVKEPIGRAGRREVLLDIRTDSYLVLSVNIEPEETTAAVCNMKGEIVKGNEKEDLLVCFPTERDVLPVTFLQTVADRAEDLLTALPEEKREHVGGISVGITGIVDSVNGVSKRAYGIWKAEVPVREILEQELGLPVTIENNVDAFAIAELLFGTGRSHDDLLIIKWGPGVGSAIVLNDSVYRGRHGKTAELGHFIVDPNGRTCSCGRKGCLETKVSYRALHEILNFTPDTFEEAFVQAKGLQRGRLDEAIAMFARCIVNAGSLIAPKRIVLCGPLFAGEKVRRALIDKCSSFDPAYHDRRILHTTLEGKERYIGPAAVYIQNKISGI